MSVLPTQIIYDFLGHASAPPLQSADAIIGFGHFDLRIAHHCGDLWTRGLAPKIIFTGGVGAGSADLKIPEAEAFAAYLRQSHPEIPLEHVMIEPRSTNTGENVRETVAQAQAAAVPLDRVILVATPFRQRRVIQTWRHHQPQSEIQSAPPPSSMADDTAVFATKGETLEAQFPGEIDRLQTYPAKGWIAPVDIPPAVLVAVNSLQT